MSDKRKQRANTELTSNFDKRAKIQVSVSEVQEMQRGYETRLARQKASIGRLVDLLHQRTAELAERMHQEVREAIEVADDAGAPLWEARSVDEAQPNPMAMSPLEVAELVTMMTQRYDLFNEDDTPFTALRGYFKWVVEEAEAYERRIGELKNQLEIAKRSPKVENIPAGLPVTPRAVEADDTPPWEKRGHVAPATVERQTPLPAPGDPSAGASETLDWAGSSQLPPGEAKPGSF